MTDFCNGFTPDCLPTQSIPVGDTGLRQAVPSRRDLGIALKQGHGRVVNAYELVCGLLAEARMHLARTLNDNWDEFTTDRAAVEFLGGADELARLRECDHQGAKLP